MNKLILVGYMGCGKSFILDKLVQKLNFEAFSLDDAIEKNQNMTINDIFDKKGELYFRKIENQIFKKSIEKSEKLVISTGGGTPCYFDNYKLYENQNCVSIYLKATVDTLCERLFLEKEKRPIISKLSNSELKEFVGPHLFERSFYYNKAKIIISVDNKTSDEIVNEIINKLSQ